MRNFATVLAAGLLVTSASTAMGQQHDRRLVDRWLYCIECVDGELDSVRVVAQRLPGPTTARLSGLLLRGVPAALLARHEQYLHRLYTRDSTYATLDSVAAVEATRREFVTEYLQAFNAGVRGRAALALGAIGGPQARMALDTALVRVPPPVAALVRVAIDSLWHP